MQTSIRIDGVHYSIRIHWRRDSRCWGAVKRKETSRECDASRRTRCQRVIGRIRQAGSLHYVALCRLTRAVFGNRRNPFETNPAATALCACTS